MRGAREKWKGYGGGFDLDTYIRALFIFLGNGKGEVSKERKCDYTMAIKR